MFFRAATHSACRLWTAAARWLPTWAAALLLVGPVVASAAELAQGRRDFNSGAYDQCIAAAEKALSAREDVEDWGFLLTEALLARGRYPEALKAATNSLALEPRSLRLLWSARNALLANGQEAAASEMASEIQRLFTSRYWMYRNARDLVIFGRVALLFGMEPKLALDRLFDGARKADPKLPDPYLASGELALEKHDFALAGRYFQNGLQQMPADPELHYGLARAYASGDQGAMLESIGRTLELNSNHVGALLLVVDHRISAEDYAEAEKLLARIETINPVHPESWAYRAVLAHLHNQPQSEAEARKHALKFRPANPRVDHLLGSKLSQKYRFAEGAAYQRRALGLDANYLPAKMQLAQDLLRLGEEDEGWRLAEEVQQADGYDVAANNLVTLRAVLAKFRTLTNQHFALRMDAREATLYGERALSLLERARKTLCSDYEMELNRPVLVEMFRDEKDFAVRTFGMPDNDGFLGVCFGHVITANSPATRPGGQFNWESMLWHEFCHVVTLQLTGNKMPRWFSEGISVYEERRANPAWGERLNPRYREMLLGKDLTPVSKLSGAFLAPKSPLHLQFAYYQSSLVIQFLVERFGREKLLTILQDLGKGMEVNDSLARNTVPMAKLEQDFEAFARKIAASMAVGVDLERPTPENLAAVSRSRPIDNTHTNIVEEISDRTWDFWASMRPTNYWVLLREAQNLADQKKWLEAKPKLERLLQLYPDHTGSGSPYRDLATTYRELGETNAELQLLSRYAEKDDQAPDVYLRLMELTAANGDWAAVLTNAQRYLALNPLVAPPYRFLAQASEAVGQPDAAIQACQALLELDPSNPAEVHYNLARLLHGRNDSQARRHVLQALEEAPRFREALRLFRQISAQSISQAAKATGPQPVATGVFQ